MAETPENAEDAGLFGTHIREAMRVVRAPAAPSVGEPPEVSALREENRELSAGIVSINEGALREIAALRSSLEEARKDSERLDWLEQSIMPTDSAERGRCVSLNGQPAAGLRLKNSWHVHLNGIGPTAWTQSARASLDEAMAQSRVTDQGATE